MVELQPLQSPISICHRCSHRQSSCNGPCACIADPERRDIIEHAASLGCPLNYFENPPPQPTPEPLKPVAREDWPLWATAIAKWSTKEDAGVGDTIHRLLGKFGEAFKATMATLGVPCECDARQVEFNTLYHY